MSALIELEKGDVVLCKDGRQMQVISIYKPDGVVRRFDGIEVDSDSPMRTAIWSENIHKILRKAPKVEAQTQEKLPDGQAVKAKDPVSQAIKDDVASRQAENKKEALKKEKESKND